MIDISFLTENMKELNKQVVCVYDLLTGLEEKLFRIDGVSYKSDQFVNETSLHLTSLDGKTVKWAEPDEVLTYDDIVYIHSNMQELFDRSGEVFKGCFTKLLRPLNTDLHVLAALIADYKERGLVIEREVECVSTAG